MLIAIFFGYQVLLIFSGSHRENAPSNKIQTLAKITNMDIWVTGTLNQLLKEYFYIRIQFSKKIKAVRGKTPFFVIRPFLLLTLFVLTLAFDRAVLRRVKILILTKKRVSSLSTLKEKL